MTTQEQVASRIDAVTNAMAADVATLRQKFADLQAAVDSGNTAAVSAAMDALNPSLTNLETMETNLHALGSDPANVVPANIPTEPQVPADSSTASTDASGTTTASTDASATATPPAGT